MRRLHGLALFGFAAVALSIAAPPVTAQSGGGARTAAVLMLDGGSRAAGMGGAYAAGTGVDALFHNPAGAAWGRTAAALSYQRHAEDIGFVSAAGAVRLGGVMAAISIGYLDFGSIAVLLPDQSTGGQRGTATGARVSAHEHATRVTVGTTLLGDRLAVAASGGMLRVAIAETGRSAFIFDAGAQYHAGNRLILGAALRNGGSSLDGAGLDAAALPGELRAGAAWALPDALRDTRVTLNVDVAAPFGAEDIAAAVGVEAAYSPDPRFTAALRGGYDGTLGEGALGRARVGAALAFDGFGLDYVFRNMDALGAVHRIGVRWTR